MRDSGPILIPLDGSPLAEGALAYGAAFGRALGERIVLVTAWEGSETEIASDFPAMALEIEQKANAHYSEYLDKVRTRLGPGLKVETRVVAGDAFEQILKAAEDTRARMLVIGTHGRSGVGRWVYGSTAGHLLREATLPLVAVGPHVLERPTADVSLKHILVPLDGSALSEAALPVATTLGAALGARLTLARVVGWAVQTYPYSLPDAYIPQVDEELEAGAKAYLTRMESEVKGVPVDAFIVRGAVADGLMDVSDKQDVDLIVMTTHGRQGLARAFMGSVAEEVARSSVVPVVIQRTLEVTTS
jgi:nucleotide-binding universal stress UspA family protein